MPKSFSRFELNKFLMELTELTKKYDISIGGCGCCGSPYLKRVDNGKTIGEFLSWNIQEEKYEADNDLPAFDL